MDSFFGIVEVESGTGGFGEVFGSLRKGSGWMLAYPVIDMQKTGLRLKRECEARHVTIPEIREFLGLAAAQSIYGWFQGKALPSLDNFYALSCYLGLRMEDLVVPRGDAAEILYRGTEGGTACGLRIRMLAYLTVCFEADVPAKR